MKKILALFIMLLVFPMLVFAEEARQISTKINLEGKEIEAGEFKLALKDFDGNVIQIKENDEEGNVVFDEIDYSNEVPLRRHVYTISMINENKDGYIYDNQVAYTKVDFYTVSGIVYPYIRYWKEQREFYIKRTTTWQTEKREIYHATEEELEGEAYAVFDPSNDTLTFFRDEPDKRFESDGKVYFRGFENSEGNYIQWGEYRYTQRIKKVIIKDSMRPKKIYSWFRDMRVLEEIEGLEKIDTSLVTDLSYVFAYTKVKDLDLSSWDTSNVTDMSYLFYDCNSLENLNVRNFDTSKVTSMSYMFSRTWKLQWVDTTDFSYESVTNLIAFMEGSAIKYVDTSKWDFNTRNVSLLSTFNNSSIYYLDFSNVYSLDGGSFSMFAPSNAKYVILGENFKVQQPIPGPFVDVETGEYIDRLFYLEGDRNPGEYVRVEDTDIPEFWVSYVEPPVVEEPEEEEVIENILENPMTNTGKIIYLILFGITLLFITKLLLKKLDYLK